MPHTCDHTDFEQLSQASQVRLGELAPHHYTMVALGKAARFQTAFGATESTPHDPHSQCLSPSLCHLSVQPRPMNGAHLRAGAREARGGCSKTALWVERAVVAACCADVQGRVGI